MTNQPTVLTLCAHPDDAEIKCGGTLLILSRKGWDVHIATLSMGDCGSAVEAPDVIASRRQREAEAAAALLGGTYHCLGGQDLRVFDDDTSRSAAVALIRTVRPDVIITHYPIDYMPDHEAASAVARAAAFTAPIVNYIAGPAASIPPTDKIPHLYYFGPIGGVDYFGNKIIPQFYVDISTVIEQKAGLLGCHESQRDWLRHQHGMDEYIEQMKRWDAEAGEQIGAAYAEGFIQHLGHAFPGTPMLQEVVML